MGKALEWIGLGSLFTLAGVRCLVRFTNEVPWELQDLASSGVTGGVGPVGTLLLDCLAIVVLGVTLLAGLLQRKRVLLGPLVLWLVGGVFVLWHSLHSADAIRTGASWLGSTALGLAALHLAMNREVRKWFVLGLASLLLPLSSKAIFQVGFEHPLTVAYYKEHKSEILAQYGWQEGDSEARRFEGRLLRNDARGAFTVGNVFATVLMGLSGVAIGIFCGFVSAWRSGGKVWFVYLSAAVVALGAASLLLTRSRGGLGAFVWGCLVAMGGFLGSRKLARHCLARVGCLLLIGVLPIIVWILGVTSKGGSFVMDPSLVVRGWHLEAARLIWMKGLITGVGPGKFQEAYMVQKNPMSPENVTDPHNIIATWISSMGIGGVAWALLLYWMVWRATALVQRKENGEQDCTKGKALNQTLAFPLGAMAVLFLLQYLLQARQLGPAAIMAWFLGALGALLMVTFLGREEVWYELPVRYGIFAGVLAVAMHIQMDMSMSDPMAAPVLMSLLGVGAGLTQEGLGTSKEGFPDAYLASSPGRETGFQKSVFLNLSACALVLIISMVLLIWFFFPLARTMEELKTAAKHAMIGKSETALKHLERSIKLVPTDPRPSYLVGVIKLQEANSFHNAGKMGEAIESYRAAIEAWDKAEELGLRRAFLCRRKAEVAVRLFGLLNEEKWKEAALKYAERAVSLDPYNRYGFTKVAEVALVLGFCEEAENWYERALRVDDAMTVLPGLKFSAKERERIEIRLMEARKACRL